MQNKTFNIPTHIEFTLYRNDYFDNLMITNILRYCKNYSDSETKIKIKISAFFDAIKKNKIINAELEKLNENISSTTFKPNSVFFLKNILQNLPNVTWLTINISYEKNFTRIVTVDKTPMAKFNYNIIEGVLDLCDVFDKTQIETFNKYLIKIDILPKNYLERKSYLHIFTSDLILLVESMQGSDANRLLAILDKFNSTLENDNPILLLKTDYSIF